MNLWRGALQEANRPTPLGRHTQGNTRAFHKLKDKFVGMSTPFRREKGTAGESSDIVQLSSFVPKAQKDLVKALAGRMAMSPSQVMEQILAHVELAGDGLPVWASRPDQEEAKAG